MRYSIKYYGGNPANSRADELIIIWHEDDTAEGLEKFIETYPNATSIVVDLTEFEGEVSSELEVIKKVDTDIVSLKLDYERHKDECQNIDIPYFFDVHVNTMDKMFDVVDCGVSQIYVTDELGFNLMEVSEYCHNRGVLIRCYPNVAQQAQEYTRLAQNEKGFWKFFIRPEDEYIFSGKIDIYEFYGPLNRQDVLMDIYKSHKWLGDLNILILDLDTSVLSYTIAPMWAEARSKCQHNCERCSVCEKVLDLAAALNDSKKMIHLDYGKEITEHYLQQIRDSIALDKK